MGAGLTEPRCEGLACIVPAKKFDVGGCARGLEMLAVVGRIKHLPARLGTVLRISAASGDIRTMRNMPPLTLTETVLVSRSSPKASLRRRPVVSRNKTISRMCWGRMSSNSARSLGLDRATRFTPWSQQPGYSDQLMMMGQSGKSSFRPEVMDYANRLTQAVRPGEYHGAQRAGTGASIAADLFSVRCRSALAPRRRPTKYPTKNTRARRYKSSANLRRLATAAFRSKPVATRADRPHHAAARASRRAAVRMAKVR